jgi:HAE1 family hydrophobic/amphiphilic exporter-1
MRMSEVCIRRPVMTTLAMTIVLLASPLVSRADEVPTITVTVQYPGGNADTMAALVAAPLERQAATIPGVASITSSNAAGITRITLEFDKWPSIDAAAPALQSAISAMSESLPQDLPAPAIVTSGGGR